MDSIVKVIIGKKKNSKKEMLQVRVEADLLKKVKLICRRYNVTMVDVVEACFSSLLLDDEISKKN